MPRPLVDVNGGGSSPCTNGPMSGRGSRRLSHEKQSPLWSSAMALSASDVAAIRAAEEALADSFEGPDPTAWVDFYTEDAVFAGPGVPTIAGRAAFLDAAHHIVISSMQIVAESTIVSGDFAATFGRATWVSGPKDSDSPVQRRRLLMVWRKEPDGRWRIARELLNEDL